MTESRPKLTFKIVGTMELASTGRSVRILIEDCHRSAFECRPIYASIQDIDDLLHGRKKVATLSVLVPAQEERE